MMLVLSRKVGYTIMIGDEVRITVVEVEGSRVTLGIEAPRDHRILRGELLDRADEPIVIELSADLPDVFHPPERLLT